MTSFRPISPAPKNPMKAPPRDWFKTPEVRTWLRDRQLPTNSVPKMLKYIRIHFKGDNPFRIVDNGIFPQSYAHWWCNYRPRTGSQPCYPILEKWQAMATEYKGLDTVADVFALIYHWLDILSLDRLLIDNEQQREGVPRLSAGVIVFDSSERVSSRQETMKYLIKEGASIFSERGWSQGLEYWNTDCKKYIF